MGHRRLLVQSAAVALLLLAASARCWADPPSLTGLAPQANLSVEDREQIASYGTYWCERLAEASQEPEEVRRARRRLIAPVNDPGVTALFLAAYGDAIRPKLESIMEGSNPLVTSNAVIVLSHLATERALETLLDHCDVRDEPRRYIRQGAARGCKLLLQSDRIGSFNPKRITSGARQLRDAARNETDRFVLRHQLEAILSADTPALPAVSREQVRSSLVEALTSVADRAFGSPGSANDVFLETLKPVVTQVRNLFLRLDRAAQHQFGPELGRCLTELLEMPVGRWEMVQEMDETKAAYGDAIGQCEAFLATLGIILDRAVDEPGSFRAAWAEGDLPAYQSRLERWRQVL